MARALSRGDVWRKPDGKTVGRRTETSYKAESLGKTAFMANALMGIQHVTPELVSLVLRLVDLIPWPARRSAMGDVTLALLDGNRAHDFQNPDSS